MNAGLIKTEHKAHFVFLAQDDEVVLDVHNWGREDLFVNGALLESNRYLRLAGSYSINLSGVEYRLALRVRNPITGVIEAEFSKGGEALSRQRAKVKLGDRFKILSMFLLVVGSLILGLGVSLLNIPVWASVPLFIAVVLGSASIRNRNYVIQEIT